MVRGLFNDSRSVFGCLVFFAESSLGGICQQGKAPDSQIGRKITCVLMQVIPCTLTVLFQSHSQSINETFTEFGNDGLVRRLAKQRIERGQQTARRVLSQR